MRKPLPAWNVYAPDSLMPSVQPSNRSGWFATSHCDPYAALSSSSAVKAMMTSRSGRRPWRTQKRTTASTIASMFFMSTAPRPQTTPSRISPENGGTLQSAGSAGTTSRCPCTSKALRPAFDPAIRATTLARPGADSRMRASTPTSASFCATYSAAGRSLQSPPPRFVVSIRMRSEVNSTTSSSATASSIDRLDGARDQRCDGLETADHLVRRRGGVSDPAFAGPHDARDHAGVGDELNRVHLDLDGERAGRHRFVPFRRRGCGLGAGADVGERPCRRAADRGVSRDVVLDRHRVGLRSVGRRVGAGPVVAGHEDDGYAELCRNLRVQVALTGPYAVRPHTGDRVREVRVCEHALGARPGVVADEGDGVDIRVLDAFDHGQVLVPAGDHARARVEVLQQQVAHGGVRLVDQHFVGAAIEEPRNGPVDVRGEHRAAPLPLLGAGL